MSTDTQVVVVGGGPAGLLAGIALAAAGVETALVATPPPPDARTTALLASSVMALETLGVWGRCRDKASPLRFLRLIDDTGRLLRAPEVKFDAAELGLDAFGYNVANRHLVAALDTRARDLPRLIRHDEAAISVKTSKAGVAVTLASGAEVTARLVIGADGRQSLCRQAAGIETTRQASTQSALAATFAHTRPHHDTSTEFHTPEGPFTTVPLPGLCSSLVWVVGPGTAKRIAAVDDTELSAEIERRSHSILGKTSVAPGRGLFLLPIETARTSGTRRIALIGEAAHVIPPIGAQGLNLGFRDAAQISELVATARAAGADVGSDALLRRYDALRRADVVSRTLAVDLLNRSLLTDFLPMQSLRGIGLHALDRIGPLRRLVMREGIAPSASGPALMRGADVTSD